MMIYNIGREINARFGDKLCNSYLICGEKNILIDTVPEICATQFVSAIESHVSLSLIDCVFLLSASPERSGALKALLEINPDIVVYSTVTGLRNLGEILNCNFNSVMCKNERDIKIGNYNLVSYITPNLTHPDCMMIYFKDKNILFSGELYSSLSDVEAYYQKYLHCFSQHCINAINVVKVIKPAKIYPAYGKNDDITADEYKNIINNTSIDELSVLVVYSSRTGNNKYLAEKTADAFAKNGVKCELCSLDNVDIKQIASLIDNYSGIVLGTYTDKRNLPSSVWQFLSLLDVNLVSGKPYFVFGSYGWSNEGLYMADEILSMLKMKRVCKPFECIFTPTEEDVQTLCACTDDLLSYIQKQKEKNINA